MATDELLAREGFSTLIENGPSDTVSKTPEELANIVSLFASSDGWRKCGWLTGGDNNIFVQVGLVVLMGLACKNAILIAEFARELEIQGKSTVSVTRSSRRSRSGSRMGRFFILSRFLAFSFECAI